MNLKKFLSELSGATAAQYTLWVALLAIAIVVGIAALSTGGT